MKRFFLLFSCFCLFFCFGFRLSFASEPVVKGGMLSSLYLSDGGTVWLWGNNSEGQLGDGTRVNRGAPVRLKGLTDVVDADLYNHVVALREDGSVWTWGENLWGALGNGEAGAGKLKTLPFRVKGIDHIVKIGAGNGFTLALKDDGTVWAWGKNTHGQLGNGTTVDQLHPVKVRRLKDVKDIQGGNGFSLALKKDGTVWAWGRNNRGQLGIGDKEDRILPARVHLSRKIKAIDAGNSHSLALDEENHVWAWGNNLSGELGNGTLISSLYPERVVKLPDTIIAVTCGKGHSLALDNTGKVWSWGRNRYGELGNGMHKNSSVPTVVVTLSDVVKIGAARYHSLALKNDGSLWTWGQNTFGQLGDKSGDFITVPSLVVFPR